MINAVRAQTSTNDESLIIDDELGIDGIKTEKFDENTDNAVFNDILEKYSSNELQKNFILISGNNELNDTEKQTLTENLRFLIKKKLNQEEENSRKEKEQVEKIQNDKLEQKEADLQQVDELKKLLAEKDEKIDAMQNDINSLREELKELSDKNHDTLESLREAKKSQDQEVIKKQSEMIRKLTQERNTLRDKYAWKLPKYEWNIKTLETKRIELKLFGNDSVDWQKVLSGPQLRFRQNLRSRKRINTTVRRLNEIWNDPKKWVNFVLTRTFGYDPLSISWKVWTGFKNMRKFFKIRDVKAFDEMYNKQKKYFIEDLESKMAANSMSENDKKVIAAIKNRLDYYQAAYKRQFIVA